MLKYAHDLANGKIIASQWQIKGAERFLATLKNKKFEYRPEKADRIITLIETIFNHKQGTTITGVPLAGTPLLLQPWQKYIVYDLFSFYYRGTEIKKYKESLIFLARKNGKSTFVSALIFCANLAFLEYNPETIFVANSLNQTKALFNYLARNIDPLRIKGYKSTNNDKKKLITYRDKNNYFEIEAMTSKAESKDGFNTFLAVCDEMHEYKSDKLYTNILDGMKANQNGLLIGITTAGDKPNGFCAQRLDYCKKVLDGIVDDERYHMFIAQADQDKNGNVDYLNPIQHQKANPNYNISVSADDLKRDSEKASADPQVRNSFFAKSLNIFTNDKKAYFQVEKFRESDGKYTWTLEELAKLPIEWYGGCDLAKLHDLTATALVGNYQDVDIIITHAFFPLLNAQQKVKEDNIPIFGWEEDGWLTLTDGETTNHSQVVEWFKKMRKKGFKIKQIGFDRKFSEEFYIQMSIASFNVVEEPQLYINKSRGFRRIEQKMYDKKLYYLHSSAFEYCISNVQGIEKTDDLIQYDKIYKTARIDLFDASVFACCRMLSNLEKKTMAKKFFGGDK